MFRAFTDYFKTLFNAIRGKSIVKTETITEVKDIGFSQADIQELNRIYPIKIYKKGTSFEELVQNSGEQKVINTITNMVKRRSSAIKIS